MVGALHKPMLYKIGTRLYMSARLKQTSGYSVMYTSLDDGESWYGPNYATQTYFGDSAYTDFLEKTNENIYLLTYAGNSSVSIYEYIFNPV